MNSSDILQAALDRTVSGRPADGDTQKRFPTLWSLLTERIDKEGHLMKPWSITIKVEGDSYQVGITHGPSHVSILTTATVLADAFTALEAACNDPRSYARFWGKGKVQRNGKLGE